MNTNGTLRYKITTAGGTDGNGDPIPASSEWSQPISCFIIAIMRNNKGKYQDGRFTQSSFKITLEKQEIPWAILELTRDGVKLGEFETQDQQPLNSVNRIHIIV